jgi:hypothetical protein
LPPKKQRPEVECAAVVLAAMGLASVMAAAAAVDEGEERGSSPYLDTLEDHTAPTSPASSPEPPPPPAASSGGGTTASHCASTLSPRYLQYSGSFFFS